MLTSIRALFTFSKSVRIPALVTSTRPVAAQPSEFHKLSLKEFALTTKSALFTKPSSEYWFEVGQEFLERFRPTTDPNKIRSYSVILYSLSKAKSDLTLNNIESGFSVILPFASPQSFASIVSSLSRLGAFSEQMSMIVRKLYESSKDRLGIRERVTVNYSMVKNGDTMDKELLEQIDKMNLKEVVTVMRMADQSGLITPEVLQRLGHHFKLRKKETNVLDLSHGLELFGKYKYLPQQVEESMNYAYKMVKTNIDAGALERIWRHFPELVNNNMLSIALTQQIVLTMRILYKRNELSDEFVREIRRGLNNIQNLQVRMRCQLK